jgi:hypothetical protein
MFYQGLGEKQSKFYLPAKFCVQCSRRLDERNTNDFFLQRLKANKRALILTKIKDKISLRNELFQRDNSLHVKSSYRSGLSLICSLSK